MKTINPCLQKLMLFTVSCKKVMFCLDLVHMSDFRRMCCNFSSRELASITKVGHINLALL